MNYPHDFSLIKDEDNKIRNEMYNMKLYEDSYYRLVKILGLKDSPIKEYIDNIFGKYLCNGKIVVAGGACLEMHPELDYETRDIDVFFTCMKEEAIDIIKEISSGEFGWKVMLTGNSVSMQCTDIFYQIQFILRLYKSPMEVVYGFDLDASGILYNGQDMYMTKRTEYSLEHKVNYFDPERSSMSYVNRLMKYALRGFKIEMPILDTYLIDHTSIMNDIRSMCVRFLKGNYPDYDCDSHYLHESSIVYKRLARICGMEAFKEFIDMNMFIKDVDQLYLKNIHNECDYDEIADEYMRREYTYPEQLFLIDNYVYPLASVNDNQMLGLIANILNERSFKRSIKEIYCNDEVSHYDTSDRASSLKIKYMDEGCIAKDEVSKLILAHTMGIIIKDRSLTYSDYSQKITQEQSMNDHNEIEYSSLKFNDVDPMTQCTGTFSPMPITQLDCYIRSSPYII